MRALWGLTGLLLVLSGCPHKKGAGGVVAPDEPAPKAVTHTHTETVRELPAGEPVHDADCRCTVEVPSGWIAYRVESDPTSIVRLEHLDPPVMRVEVFHGDERVPRGEAGFLDSGPYLPGDDEREVTVWTVDDAGEDDVRRFGVMLPGEGIPVVVEGWLPYEDFEPAKRALDAVIRGITFGNGGTP